MDCPKCHQTMKKRSWRTTHNPETGKDDYDETIYHCETDDIWLTIDIPVETNDKSAA